MTVIAATLYLAYYGLQRHFARKRLDDHHLAYVVLNKGNYLKVLKECLPFAVYPMTILTVPVARSFSVMKYNMFGLYIMAFFGLNFGIISSIVFLIHIKVLGQHRRNKFKKRSRFGKHNKTAKHNINDGQMLTAFSSMIGAHDTDSYSSIET